MAQLGIRARVESSQPNTLIRKSQLISNSKVGYLSFWWIQLSLDWISDALNCIFDAGMSQSRAWHLLIMIISGYLSILHNCICLTLAHYLCSPILMTWQLAPRCSTGRRTTWLPARIKPVGTSVASTPSGGEELAIEWRIWRYYSSTSRRIHALDDKKVGTLSLSQEREKGLASFWKYVMAFSGKNISGFFLSWMMS